MIIQTLIASILLVAIVMVALGIKMLFDPNAEFTAHACSTENGSLDKNGACALCQVKELADCSGDQLKLK